MKKIYLLTAVSVLTLSGAEVWAAEANGTGNISAKIVAPVNITEQDALDFGTNFGSDRQCQESENRGGKRCAQR